MKLDNPNRQMAKIRATIFYFGLLTLVTVIVWISTGIYFSYTKSTIDPEMTNLIKPLNPVLDLEALETYASGRVVPPETFQIVTIVGEGKKQTISSLNPFNPVEIQKASPPATSSAGL